MDKMSNRRRDHLANERTFLAWIRTSIGLMAFGFVIEKFSLFVREISFLFSKDHMQFPSEKGSSIFGIILVGIGALICIFSYLRFIRVEKEIELAAHHKLNKMVVGLTLLVIVIGVFLSSYLIDM